MSYKFQVNGTSFYTVRSWVAGTFLFVKGVDAEGNYQTFNCNTTEVVFG